jgi:hypothetical protein
LAYRSGKAEYPESGGASQLSLEELDDPVVLELARTAGRPVVAGEPNALSTPPGSPPPSAGQLLGLLEELLVLEDDA